MYNIINENWEQIDKTDNDRMDVGLECLEEIADNNYHLRTLLHARKHTHEHRQGSGHDVSFSLLFVTEKKITKQMILYRMRCE